MFTFSARRVTSLLFEMGNFTSRVQKSSLMKLNREKQTLHRGWVLCQGVAAGLRWFQHHFMLLELVVLATKK